jgi:hypothetical protein
VTKVKSLKVDVYTHDEEKFGGTWLEDKHNNLSKAVSNSFDKKRMSFSVGKF